MTPKSPFMITPLGSPVCILIVFVNGIPDRTRLGLINRIMDNIDIKLRRHILKVQIPTVTIVDFYRLT